MVDNEQMVKSFLQLSISWFGTGITLATIGGVFGIITGTITMSYTIYKWICDVKDRKESKASNKLCK